ncbi:alpha/beta fold hydrolase [Paenibacillus thalictri]|uniref:S9 family peptidase n=1 Tax=Paenibacillus thalictri TaxID=2527873 RepID=A0A4Q9DZ68_9BACL|nr:prolyl oligopeptidase family serine peptidase [Paenibacillus thalictri]TBL81143.1 S9 family peptidase [Paenibacillus thalictri]
MNRHCLTFFLFLLFISWTFAGAASANAEAVSTASGYRDVPAGHYAAKQIADLSRSGIIEGDADGLFHPDEDVTRGVAALWLSRALKLPVPASLKGFTDVPESSPYAVAVNALKEKEVVQGDGGLFSPDAPLTREQMASLLVRAFQLKGSDLNVWFKDEASIGASHFDDVVKLKQNFITEQAEYMPKNKVTRAQLVLFLTRATTKDDQDGNGIPLKDFLRGSDRLGSEVSPNGKRTAYLQISDNHPQLYVKKVGEESGIRITSVDKRSIEGFFWFNDERLVYMTDLYGTENYQFHAVNADGTDSKDLTPFEGKRAQFMDDISYLPGHENDILIQSNKENSRFFDVYQLNVKTGALKLVAQNPGNVSRWLSDIYGIVRLAIATDGTNQTVLYRETENDEFKPVLKVDPGDAFNPIMFSLDGRQVYVLTNIGRDKQALMTFGLNTKSLVETIYENPDANVTGLVFSYKKEAIIAATYETDKRYYHFLDKEFEKLNQSISAKLNGEQFVILGNPLPEKTVRLRTVSDTSPGTYYFYNRLEDKLTKIDDVKPWIDPSKMSPMKPIKYMSRDGYTINGYLTIPKGADPKQLPVVVLPHGGPWARDSWGFDSEVQLLAYHGYAVLQMNFRGSTGYGKKFLNAGNKQWGNTMQNDITDGVKWLIDQGIADPKKIAIYGASYGGYAALAGVTFTPDLYAAGVDYMGPSSLTTFLDTIPDYWDKNEMYAQVGDPIRDKQMMDEYSPVLHVDKIKVPVFIAQGFNDPRVNKNESNQMVVALRAKGIDAPYMIKMEEGHGFQSLQNRIDFYTALLKFLDNHLKDGN